MTPQPLPPAPSRTKGLLYIMILIAVSALLAFSGKRTYDKRTPYNQSTDSTEKKYCVSLPFSGWVERSNYLEYVKQTLKQSDIPAKQSNFIIDSLLSPFQREIADQVNGQLKDTTKKK